MTPSIKKAANSKFLTIIAIVNRKMLVINQFSN